MAPPDGTGDKTPPLTILGRVRSPYTTLAGIPIQNAFSETEGVVEIYPEYAPALDGLEGFQYIYLLTWFHVVRPPVPLRGKPFLMDAEVGMFAMRTPRRVNPIGLSIVELLHIEGTRLHVKGLDVLDDTPVIDIKPYVPPFDRRETTRIGWLEGRIRPKTS